MSKKKVKQKVKSEPAQKQHEDPVLKEIIVGIAGERGYEIAKALARGEITAEGVAKGMNVHISLVRKILYDLYSNRVVNFRRVTDKHSGLYIYYWRIEPERALEYFNKNKHLLLRKLEERLEAERSTSFFSCGDGGHKLPFELAIENEFKCPRCGGKLEPYDNSSMVVALERRIESLRRQLIQNIY